MSSPIIAASAASMTPGRARGRFSLSYVKDTYGVPARRGMRVRVHGRDGLLTSGDGAHVRVRLDGESYSRCYHPLDVDYFDGVDPAARLARRNARIEVWNDRLNDCIDQAEYERRMTELAGDPPAVILDAGDFDDEDLHTDHDRYDRRKLRVDCPNCGRSASPLCSPHTRPVDGGWRWVGVDHQEPFCTYLTRCRGCRREYRFTTHTPQ